MEPWRAWIVTASSRTFSSLSFCREKASCDWVSLNSANELVNAASFACPNGSAKDSPPRRGVRQPAGLVAGVRGAGAGRAGEAAVAVAVPVAVHAGQIVLGIVAHDVLHRGGALA